VNLDAASAWVLGREAVRELDARTIAAGTPSLNLMEAAGAALAKFVAEARDCGLSSSASSRGRQRGLLILAGPGNNGGDGFVVARLLQAAGWNCRVALGAGPSSPDAVTNLAAWNRAGGQCIGRQDAVDLMRAGSASGFELILDALYGTGLTRPVEGADADLIHCINESSIPVISADIPSGLCSNKGRPLGIAVRARATLALGAAKLGLFLAEGPDYAGRVSVAEIGLLPPSAAGLEMSATVIDDATTAGCWPRLARRSHKGTRGHVLIVAGSLGKTGAAVLAARGALRAGAGLVTVASVAEVQAAVSQVLPEAMTTMVAADDAGQIDCAGIDVLTAAAAAADAIVIGPGLGTGAGASAAVERLASLPVPLILDADALTIVAGWSKARRDGVFAARIAAGAPAAVLTPHPGEMGRLTGMSSADVQQARDVTARSLAKELGVIVVLKGAATIVCDNARIAFNLSGNPGMACAGMGDVLSGVCGALAARRTEAEAASPTAGAAARDWLDPFERACLAVHVHGAAGDHLESTTGPGFLASELADRVPFELASRMPR